MRKVWEVYSRKTGFEIFEGVRTRERKGYLEKRGVVWLRAFEMEGEKRKVWIMLSPREAHTLSKYLKGVLQVSKPARYQAIVHKFEKNGNESVAKVEVERWEREKKVGFSLIFSRDSVRINVPMTKEETSFVSDLLYELSIRNAFFETEKVEPEEDSSETSGEGADEAFPPVEVEGDEPPF